MLYCPMMEVDFHVVPGSSQKMLDKTRGLTVDCAAFDLEDSVTASKKVEARHNVRQFLAQPKPDTIREYAVRINSVGSVLAEDDLLAVVGDHLSMLHRCL